MTGTIVARRASLKAAGICMGLPLLESMEAHGRRNRGAETTPRRMVAMCAPLGIHTPYLYPEQAGAEFTAPAYLEPLESVRDSYSVISGLMHPMVDGGHAAEKSFLTAAPHPGRPSFRNTISVDQYAAERIGHLTRYPFLSLSADSGGISYTRSGVLIPSESRPSRVFARLFLEGTSEQKRDHLRRIRDGRSILDLVAGQATGLHQRISREDARTMDQYLGSIRDLEKRLLVAEDYAQRPKPDPEVEPPSDIDDRADFTGRMKLLLDLMVLALRTDSTRLITLKGPGGNEVVNLRGVGDGWHNLSHHGRSPEKIEQLAIIEKEEMRLFAAFLEELASIREGGEGESLLDRTAILLGSNLGNASSHSNTNLPIVLAGGRFRHGQHLAFNPQDPPPLANLFVSLLRHLQLEVDLFATGLGPLSGLV